MYKKNEELQSMRRSSLVTCMQLTFILLPDGLVRLPIVGLLRTLPDLDGTAARAMVIADDPTTVSIFLPFLLLVSCLALSK
jgi:hypothetical protein